MLDASRPGLTGDPETSRQPAAASKRECQVFSGTILMLSYPSI